jgi:nuclear transport factor 2 (NTF2) superfamily protein
MICALPFLMLIPVLPGITPTAEEIMCRVAENQERARAERTAYVYDMDVFVRMKRANGKLAREESRQYVVAPTEKGARRRLVKVEGKVQAGNKEILYTEDKFHYKSADIDGAVTRSIAQEILWKKNENGQMVDWFPLTGERQKNAAFQYQGEERYRDYDVYRIAYEEHDDGDCWRGEALIEKKEFQPVLISSEWSCRIPAAVKVLLGTNVTNLGVKITYQRFAEGVWFPVTSGGELKVRVLFLYARTIAFSAKNSAFHKADVQSSIQFESEPD